MKAWMFLVLFILLLWMTNPSYDAHREKLLEKGGPLASFVLGWNFERKDHLLYSVGTCGTNIVTVGILGKVF